jgi:uncharacterized protein (TIRG00374 family)
MKDAKRRLILNFAFAFLLLGAFLHLIGWGKIVDAISSASPLFVALGFLAGMTSVVFWSLTWKVVLDLAGWSIGFLRLQKIYFAGMFANSVTPLGQFGGEPFIAYILSKNTEMEYEDALGCVVSSDILNAVPHFTFSFAALTFFLVLNLFNPFLSILAGVVMFVTFTMLVLVYFLWYRRDRAEGIVLGAISYINRIYGMFSMHSSTLIDREEIVAKVRSFYETLDSIFTSKWEIVEVGIISHAAWFLTMVSLYSFLLSVGWKVDPMIVILVLSGAGLAFFLPLPGGLGGIDIAMTGLLILLASVPGPVASAAVILYRAANYGFQVVAGGLAALLLSVEITRPEGELEN